MTVFSSAKSLKLLSITKLNILVLKLSMSFVLHITGNRILILIKMHIIHALAETNLDPYINISTVEHFENKNVSVIAGLDSTVIHVVIWSR